MHLRLTYLIIAVCWSWVGYSQNTSLSNLRSRLLQADSAGVVKDSLTIIPETVQIIQAISGQPLDSSQYRIINNEIHLVEGADKSENFKITYRVLPYNLGANYNFLSNQVLTSQVDGTVIGFDYNPYEREEKVLDFRGLDYNGSFSRGISFGNSQDLVLNSRFNLQLAGNLGDGVEILAAITDENIPIQPEGNTQQLREFDRIFIQLKKDNNQLIAGDYELRRPNSYFMNYFKKLQGATFTNQSKVLEKGNLTTQASLAISRGKFARNNIEQQEGNQGPYKLRGAEGERFIIVLAGTEKVWIDGIQLKRGLEEDYIIDYNQAELSFTNRRLITKDSRIIVEFEYSDQSYLRSLYAINTTYEQDRLQLRFNMLSQQDSKTPAGGNTLSDQEIERLREAGDDFSMAVVSSIDTVEEFNEFRSLYVLRDTFIQCGLLDSLVEYIEFSTNPEEANYSARFSFVGAGNGQYVIDNEQIANERVYRWVGIDSLTCQPRGDYEPIVQLVAPKQQQMFTFGGDYTFGEDAFISAEVAASRNDLNRFSRLDKENDVGLAAFINGQKTFKLGKDSSRWRLETEVSYEFLDSNFTPLNPYRNAEFNRDWNIADLNNTPQRANEHIGRAGFRLVKSGLGSLRYLFSGFYRDTIYTGIRHLAEGYISRKGWELDLTGNWLFSEGNIEQSNFSRPKVQLSKKIKKWTTGVYGEREKNERFDAGVDTLSNSSFFYDLYRVFLQSEPSEKFEFGTHFSQRIDYTPIGKNFEEITRGNEFNVNGKWTQRKKNNRYRINGNFTYRQLIITDTAITSITPAETFLGRTDFNMAFLKGAINSTTTYEIGSGQEPKLEVQYLPVEPGQGTHIWLDSLFNNDGIIQNNEMEIAPFQDIADYVKVTNFTDEFIRTNNVNFNQSLQLNLKQLWYNSKGWKKLASRFSTLSNLKISRKTQDADNVSPWNPFQLAVADTALVAVTSAIRNALYYNRGNSVYDLEVGQTDNRNKIVQTSGFESRQLSEWYLRSRWNFSKKFTALINTRQGLRISDSEFFNSKDFEIDFFNISPEVSFLPVSSFRAVIKYQYQRDQNQLPETGEQSIKHDFTLEATYRKTAKTSIRTQVSIVDIKFEGDPSSPVGFAMLNGLQPGQNYLWNVNLERQIAKNILLSISYEGRKTGTASIVHVGRANISANF